MTAPSHEVATLHLGGDEVIPLLEVALMLAEPPAKTFARGTRGEFRLVRIDAKRWGARRWEIEVLAGQLNPKSSSPNSAS